MKNTILPLFLLLTLFACEDESNADLDADLATQIEGTFIGEFNIWGEGVLNNYELSLEKVSSETVKLNSDHFTDVLITLSGTNSQTAIFGTADSLFSNFNYVIENQELQFFTGEEVFEGFKE